MFSTDSDAVPLRHSLRLFVQLFRLIRPYHKDIVKGVVFGPIIGLVGVVPPYFSKLLFDRVASTYDFNLLSLLVLGIVVVSIGSALLNAIIEYYTVYLNVKLENTTTLLFFNHIQHLPYSFFYQRQVGEISSRFQEVKSALTSVHSFLRTVLGQGIYILVVPPFLFLLQWKLAIVALLSVPLSSVLVLWLSTRLRASWKQVVESHADLEATQMEMLNHIATVKALGLEETLYNKASAQLTAILNAHLETRMLNASLTILNAIINALNIGLLTWLGWRFILSSEMSVGDYVAFTLYVGYLRGPIMEAISLFTNFQQWSVNLSRVFEYLEVAPEQDPTHVTEAAGAVRHRLRGELALDQVTFAYDEQGLALERLSLRVEPGEVVVFIGDNGSGKSTLLRLLTGIERGYDGRILFDGIPMEEIPLHDLRSALGVVLQDVELFRGTLRNNLVLGMSKEVSQAWLERVVELCGLVELIAELPDGYDTFVVERGLTLSGGQRQRVALARALIRRTPFLILDEAMSNLDVETEVRLAKDLVTLAREQGQTVLFVTHRMSVTRLADRVYLMDQGRIVDVGAHDELMTTSAKYRRLQQLSEDMSADAPA